MTIIHPTALIDPGAQLGPDVEIGPFSIIGPNVRIGARTKVKGHVVVEGHTTIGEDNTLFQFASIGAPPQDLKYRGEPTTLVIGSRNVIREYVTLHPGTATGTTTTVIGDDNLFMCSSHVAHDCRVGSRNVFANSATLAGHVEVGDSVIIGGLVGVHQFTRVGDLSFLGAGSMVSKDVPPFSMAQGDRCHLRGLNLIGVRRAGISAAEIALIKRAHRHLFWHGGGIAEKLETLAPDLKSSPIVERILAFVRGSKRGFISPRKLGGVEDDEE